jgi:hypothetical protein
MSTPKSPNRIALYSIRAFIACMLIFYFLYFFGLTGSSKQQAIFTGVFTSGVISIWAGYYYQTTKAPIFRGLSPYKRNQTVIEYSKDASDHTSSVLGLFVLGIFFVILGLNGMFNA